jgi:hypothetical protein
MHVSKKIRYDGKSEKFCKIFWEAKMVGLRTIQTGSILTGGAMSSEIYKCFLIIKNIFQFFNHKKERRRCRLFGTPRKLANRRTQYISRTRAIAFRLWPCLVPRKKHYVKKRFPITSNLRYMHEVLNVDEIKN